MSRARPWPLADRMNLTRNRATTWNRGNLASPASGWPNGGMTCDSSPGDDSPTAANVLWSHHQTPDLYASPMNNCSFFGYFSSSKCPTVVHCHRARFAPGSFPIKHMPLSISHRQLIVLWSFCIKQMSNLCSFPTKQTPGLCPSTMKQLTPSLRVSALSSSEEF